MQDYSYPVDWHTRYPVSVLKPNVNNVLNVTGQISTNERSPHYELVPIFIIDNLFIIDHLENTKIYMFKNCKLNWLAEHFENL